jgi:serine/threonine protein kinase
MKYFNINLIYYNISPYFHFKIVIDGKQSETNQTGKAAPVNTAGGSIHYIMYIGIVFAVLILTIVVVKVYQYKYKYRQFLEEGRPPEEYRRKKSRDYGSVSFKTLIYGQIDRIVPTKDVKSQAAFLPYDSKREIKRTSFAVLEEIGSGNFGSVARGELMGLYSPDSKTTVAIKTVNGSAATGNELMDLLQEIKLMSFVQPHLNLVSMIGSCKCDLEKSGDLWLLLEFCQYGDLKNYLAKNETKILRGGEDDPLNSRCLIKWAYDVCKGMEYLSENKIMHGDLAARNVLLDESPVLKGHSVGKVADFGMSKKFYENTNYQKESRVMVPWKWMAYEFLTKGFFTLASDVWSFQVGL